MQFVVLFSILKKRTFRAAQTIAVVLWRHLISSFGHVHPDNRDLAAASWRQRMAGLFCFSIEGV
jgi:hypothetical protein